MDDPIKLNPENELTRTLHRERERAYSGQCFLYLKQLLKLSSIRGGEIKLDALITNCKHPFSDQPYLFHVTLCYILHKDL